MTEPEIVKKATTSVKKSIRLPRYMHWLREALAALVWLGAIAQLLIFDLGSFIAGYVPGFDDVLQFRFPIFLGTTALLWLLLGNRRFIVFCVYIIFYPFVFVGWHVPRVLFRNWPLLIAFSPAIFSLFRTFKVNFILFSIAVISSFVIFVSSNQYILGVFMVLLYVYLVVHFTRRFRTAFSPSTIFADVGTIIHKMWDAIKKSDFAKRPDIEDVESDEYKKKVGEKLLSLYLLSTGLYFLGQQLQKVIKSHKLDIYFVASLLYTVLVTTIVFSIEFHGLEKFLPGSFIGPENITWASFLGLSFSTLIPSGISPIKAGNGWAEFALYSESFCSLLIIVLLVFVILTSIRERYKQDLDKVVEELSDASESVGEILRTEYNLTTLAAEVILINFNPALTKWLLQFRHGEEHVRQILEIIESENSSPEQPTELPPAK